MSEELKARIAELGPWYHDIALADGIRTEGWKGIAHVWDHIRTVRLKVDYLDAAVLDLGSRDGMWAFEAETSGAKAVVAFELGIVDLLERFLFCRQARGSRVIPMYGADAERVDQFCGQFINEFGLFDVVQHFGLLYHLKNPMQSLESCRRVMKTGGKLIIETAGATDERPIMLSNRAAAVYVDAFTYWAPTMRCLEYMLAQSGFHPVDGSQSILYDTTPRIALIAEAI